MKNIFLIGMPSSGKSTLGRKLARTLNYRFVDLDKLIEKDQNNSISQIFATKGEGYFREVERRILLDTKPDHWLVVATGGGVPCFFDNMDFIKKNGLSIYINVPPNELAERILKHGKDDRPLLSGITELEKELRERLRVRQPFYSRADYVLDHHDISIKNLVEILKPHL